MTFRQRLPSRWHRVARVGQAVCVATAIVVALAQLSVGDDPLPDVRADAATAHQALKDGDLPALDEQLAAHRGDTEFAYLFTVETTPRVLGDALSSVAGGPGEAGLDNDVDADGYDVALTDLAGTLSLATHGEGDRGLSPSWSKDFITATTAPELLYQQEDTTASGQARADQDRANRQNLLLLLSRGYWSTDFLREITSTYWAWDHAAGGDGWDSAPSGDARYAPAPTGTYLNDGILALAAALTANPEASAWAFTDFQPGSVTVGGTDYSIGKFTNFLLSEHHYPESSDGDSVGATTALTALSSAIDHEEAASDGSSPAESGPAHDSVVLQTIADAANDQNDCSWNPLTYWHCVETAATVSWEWIQTWGHPVLAILSKLTLAPPPFQQIGIAAATTNATWYAIDGDWSAAGLSLATALHASGFVRAAQVLKAGANAEKAAEHSDEIAAIAAQFVVGIRS